jgi:hypothetical protein
MIFLIYLYKLIIGAIFFSIVSLITAYLHELGHAAMHRIFFGDSNWHITLGVRGKPIIRLKKYTIRTWFMISGEIIFENNTGGKWPHIMRAAGGAFVNFALIVVIALVRHWGAFIEMLDTWILIEDILTFILNFNIIMLLATLIPMRYPWPFKDRPASDGLGIYKILTSKKKPSE